MRSRSLFFGVLCVVAGTAAFAQVSVNEETVEKKHYSSPVVLDVNFNLAHESLWGAGRVSPKQSLDAYICEGIYVDDFGMDGKGKGSAGKQDLDATIYYTLNSEPGTPKRRATVRMQLFDGDTAITKPVAGKTVTLKGGKQEKQNLRIRVPVSMLKTDPLTTLKLTLTVDK